METLGTVNAYLDISGILLPFLKEGTFCEPSFTCGRGARTQFIYGAFLAPLFHTSPILTYQRVSPCFRPTNQASEV